MSRKILILANNDTGLWRFRRELLMRLLDEGFEVHISLPFGTHIGKLTAMGCIFTQTPFCSRRKNPFRDAGLLLHYCRLVRELRPVLVVCYTIKPNIYGGLACRFLKTPCVANITGLGSVYQHGGPLRAMVTKLYRAALKNARVVFFENSDNLRFFLSEHIVSAAQTALVPGAGVNLSEYPFTPMPCEKPYRFLFIGRLMKEKGLQELLCAARETIRQFPGTEFEIVGEAPESGGFTEKKTEADSTIRFLGFQEDVRPFIRRCHCVVLPSYHEGLANALLEAAAMGRPLIASNIPGCREAVLPGINGYLCDVRSCESLARCLRRFILLPDNTKRRMGEASRRHAETAFDRNAVVDMTLGRMKAVLSTAQKEADNP